MNGTRRAMAVLVTTATSIASLLAAPPLLAADASVSCTTQSEPRQPVLLVHGFNSNARAWDASKDSFADSNTCVATFDYGADSTDWVTSPAIGRSLAAAIHKLAIASRAGGGTGKVIVVAHSMGGLAVRCAVSSQCGGGSHFELRELITLGTPNHGTILKSYGASDLADLVGPYLSYSAGCYGNDDQKIPGLCQEIQALGTSAAGKAFTPGSSQLNALPDLSGYIPDYAEAGSFPITTDLFLHTFTVGDLGDLVVARESALSEAHTAQGTGGTGQLVHCGSLDLISGAFTFHCWHGTETVYSGFISQAQHEITRIERVDGTLYQGSQYHVYRNSRFGFSFQIPASFQPQAPNDNRSGQQFTSSVGHANVDVFGSYNQFGDTPTTILDRCKSTTLANGGKITYTSVSGAVAICSGYAYAGGPIFYDYAVIRSRTETYIYWAYDTTSKAYFDGPVQKSVTSLKLGPN